MSFVSLLSNTDAFSTRFILLLIFCCWTIWCLYLVIRFFLIIYNTKYKENFSGFSEFISFCFSTLSRVLFSPGYYVSICILLSYTLVDVLEVKGYLSLI